MISTELLAIVRCPECRGVLEGGPAELRCRTCDRRYDGPGRDYLDLRPATEFAETTKYVDEALHANARHETVSPPLLSAAIRNDMLRAFLKMGSGDRVIDLGCGSGRVLVWNRELGGHLIGADISPFFASEACAEVDLTLADLRRLPFADATFTKAYSLDVLEHLSPEGLMVMLREAGRVLAPGGALFVYSHVRKNSPLALGLKSINRIARGLERIGLIDITEERLRKSDHLNPLADIPELHRVAATAGFDVERIRYYTPLVGGFIENIVVRMAERIMTRRAARRLAHGTIREWEPQATLDSSDQTAARAARTEAKRRIAKRGPAYVALRAATWLMKLDLILFGRMRSGPFFALLVKR